MEKQLHIISCPFVEIGASSVWAIKVKLFKNRKAVAAYKFLTGSKDEWDQ